MDENEIVSAFAEQIAQDPAFANKAAFTSVCDQAAMRLHVTYAEAKALVLEVLKDMKERGAVIHSNDKFVEGLLAHDALN